MDENIIWNRFGIKLENDLNTDLEYIIFMEKVTIGVLKQIVEKVPDDYVVIFNNGKRNYSVGDKLEVDISEKQIIFHKY